MEREMMSMPEKTCGDCAHFIQHYRRAGKRFVSINYGHCIALRAKSKKALNKICEHFQEQCPVE